VVSTLFTRLRNVSIEARVLDVIEHVAQFFADVQEDIVSLRRSEPRGLELGEEALGKGIARFLKVKKIVCQGPSLLLAFGVKAANFWALLKQLRQCYKFCAEVRTFCSAHIPSTFL